MRSHRAILFALTMAATMALGPACAGEAYQPDPTLVEAAKKEGQVLWYTTLIVDQIVRPLIKSFQQQFPGIDVKFIRIDSGQQVTRLINEASVGRTQADVWNVIDGATSLVQKNIAAEFDIASAPGVAGNADRSHTGAGSPPISLPARSPITPTWSTKSRRRAPIRTCSIRAGKALSSGIRTP